MITQERVNQLLDSATWKFAKSMPKFPHDYTLRSTWGVDSEFVDVVKWIRENGTTERWYKKTFIYYYYNGYKYWTMGNPVCYIDKQKTILINRAKTPTDDTANNQN
jgi:hypothetical protein